MTGGSPTSWYTVLAVAVVAGLYHLFTWAWKEQKEETAARWPTAVGHVVSVDESRDENGTLVATLAYTYKLEGERYSGYKSVTFVRDEDSLPFEARYKGKSVLVHYRPDKPSISELTDDIVVEPEESVFPPVPDWRPTIQQPMERIVDRVTYYTDGKSDFAVFKYGTCVLLADGLSEIKAEAAAKDVLHQIVSTHVDMKPMSMDDGNILVKYNHPAVNVVLADVVQEHWADIDANHQRALATSEAFLTPAGVNVFDDHTKKALFGRCFMFMDAQDPKIVRVVRKSLAH